MRGILLASLAALSLHVAAADNVKDAKAKLHEYFETFNKNDIHKVTTEIYSTPLHTGFGSNHGVLATPAEAFESLDEFRKQISSEGWVKFRIDDVQTCELSDTLVLLDTHYTGIYKEGSDNPGTSSTLMYVLQKIDDNWRIIAYYGHDHDKRPTCG